MDDKLPDLAEKIAHDRNAPPLTREASIPWARYADNGLDNLVVTHQRCNNQQRDFLAAADHVEKLVARKGANGGQLDEIATQEAWTRDGARSRAVGRAFYSRLPKTARVWLRGQDLVPIERERVLTALR